MSNITTALIIVLCINAVLFLTQMAVVDISGDSSLNVFNPSGSILCSFENNNCADMNSLTLNASDPGSNFPESQTGVSPDTGNLFTDIWTSIRGFFMNTLGLKYLVMFLTAPISFLNAMQLPGAFVFVVGSVWYGITFFLLISYLWGRDA